MPYRQNIVFALQKMKKEKVIFFYLSMLRLHHQYTSYDKGLTTIVSTSAFPIYHPFYRHFKIIYINSLTAIIYYLIEMIMK